MRPLGWIGVILLIIGVGIVAKGGLGYTKSRNEMQVGPMKVATEERGIVPPVAGVAAILIGGALVFAGRKKG